MSDMIKSQKEILPPVPQLLTRKTEGLTSDQRLLVDLFNAADTNPSSKKKLSR